jgi:hypothetical protein
MFFGQTVLIGPPLHGQQNWEQTCSEYLEIFSIWEMQFKVENTKLAASSLHSSQGQCARKQCFMSRWAFFHAKGLLSIWLQMNKQDFTNALIQKENGSISTAVYCLTKVKLKKSFSQYNFMCCIPCTEFYILSVLNHILDFFGLNWERDANLVKAFSSSVYKALGRYLAITHTFIHLLTPITYIHTTIYNSVSYNLIVMKCLKTK